MRTRHCEIDGCRNSRNPPGASDGRCSKCADHGLKKFENTVSDRHRSVITQIKNQFDLLLRGDN